MAGNRPTLLLTGGSGVLGRALIEELPRDFDVICLTHRQSLDDPRVREMRGDLSRPGLGLDRAAWARLRAETDVVVHSGAVTRLARGFERADAVNVRGTEQMLDLAARADARYVHVSTAFVARRDGSAGPAGQRGTQGPMSMAPYLWSKDRADALVRSSGLPHALVRPSVLIGDAATGRISAFQGMYSIFGALLEGQLPLLPGTPDTTVDFVPRDIAARAVAALAGDGFTPGEHWLCAGDDALPAHEMIDLCVRVGTRLGTGARPPRLVSPDMVDRLLLPLAAEALPPGVRKGFEGMAALVGLFRPRESFDSSLAAIDPALRLTRTALAAAFARSLEFFARSPTPEAPARGGAVAA